MAETLSIRVQPQSKISSNRGLVLALKVAGWTEIPIAKSEWYSKRAKSYWNNSILCHKAALSSKTRSMLLIIHHFKINRWQASQSRQLLTTTLLWTYFPRVLQKVIFSLLKLQFKGSIWFQVKRIACLLIMKKYWKPLKMARKVGLEEVTISQTTTLAAHKLLSINRRLPRLLSWTRAYCVIIKPLLACISSKCSTSQIWRPTRAY